MNEFIIQYEISLTRMYSVRVLSSHSSSVDQQLVLPQIILHSVFKDTQFSEVALPPHLLIRYQLFRGWGRVLRHFFTFRGQK